MTSTSKSSHASLKDWEEWLAPQVRQVELLGEIPITADECAELGKTIGLRVKGLGHSRALRILKDNYPYALAVYLVAQGIYGYRGGDYWSEVIQVTNLKRAYAWQVGQAFEVILEEMDLPLFYDMREEAHRYVSLILAHGGIPNYCLPDFFKNMLQPSVLRMQYADMSAAELIDQWSWRSSVQYFTDKPVIRFLVYGDRVAWDFVERCREMAWEYLDSGLVPDGDQVGLPERVVEAYRQWIAEQGAEQVERETGERWRLRKPDVLVDPWGEGVYLALPPQQVPATEVYADVAWQVKAGDETHVLPVRVRRTGFDWKTTEESLPLRRPAETFEVSLLANGQAKNTWRYQGLDDKHPLLVFDAERSTLQRLSYSLPARRLGLLYPAQLDLRVEGDACLVEEWPRMPWGWAVFRGQTWDLGGADHFNLGEDGQEILTVVLRPDEAKQQPALEGGYLLSPEKLGVRAPVYEGPPPSVRIPLMGRRHLEEELVRWWVTVQNKWAASPSLKRTETLADLRSRLVIREGYVDLPLRHPSLLGEQPFGNYLVRLRGPLGRGAEFTLRIVPHMAVTGHEELHLPDAQSGPMPATLHIETLLGYHLECEGVGGACRAEAANQQGDRWEFRVEVDPDVTEVELTLVRRLPSGDTVRVPVTVPIRRLRWALVSDQTGVERRDWTGHIIKVPVDALLQGDAPCLLVDLPTGNLDQVRLGLRMVDIDGTVLQVADSVPLPAGQRLLRFDLAAFLDTIRSNRSPVLRLELEGQGLPGRPGPQRWPILSLTQSLIVQDVEVAGHLRGETLSVTVRWQEPTPLRNRRLRFWPLWRPWEAFYEKTIADGTEGMLSFDVSVRELPLSKYRLEFLVVDPWIIEDRPRRPRARSTGTADVELVTAVDRLAKLTGQISKHGPRLDVFLERAHVRMGLGDTEGSYADQTRCYERLDEGTIPQILALRDLMEGTDNKQNLKALQMRMFTATRMEPLVHAYRQGEISEEHFRDYMANLPRPGLLPQKTCEYLLEVGDEAVQLQAVEALVGRSNPRGLEAVLSRVEKAELSDADAVALLKANMDFSVVFLQKRVSNPDALRLLRAISQDMGDRSPIVQVGTWVFCDAGWGRIEQIEDLEGRPMEHFIRGQTGYRLRVTLRPSVDAEPVVVDLDKRDIHFLETNCFYTCTKCDSFSSRDWNLLTSGHNKVAHGGIGPAFRIEKTCILWLQTVNYSRRAPREQLSIPLPTDGSSEVH